MRKLLFILSLICSGSISAQITDKLEGYISDSESGEPLPYASLRLNTGRGTISNMDGEFSLEVSPDDKQIVISYIGYNSQTYSTENLPAIIKLSPMAYQLGEVLVVPINTHEIIEQLFEQSKKQIQAKHQPVYNFFYRQVTRTDNVYNEMQEAFINATGILSLRDLRLTHGRYAGLTSDSLNRYLNFRNFFSLSQVTPIDLKKISDKTIITFLRKDYDKYYNVSADVLTGSSGELIYKLIFSAKNEITMPIAYGSLYVKKESMEILKLEAGLKNNLMKFTNGKSLNDDNIKFSVNYKPVGGQPVVESVYVTNKFMADLGLGIIPIEINSILFNAGTALEQKGSKLKHKDALMKEIGSRKYNPEFWENNPVVKRTPLENEIISMFEKQNLFTNYTN